MVRQMQINSDEATANPAASLTKKKRIWGNN
jgi:hypothetical protein